MAELAAVEEEEVFLRRSSGQFGDGGGSGVSQSMLMPGHLSQEGNIQAVNPLSSHLHHHHHHLQQQQQQQQPAWVRGSASLGGSKGFVQGQSGLQSPIVGSQEVAAAGCVQGHGGGPGLEAGEDEVFECGGEECEYDLNRLDLSGHEAALLTQPSAAPSAFTDERLKPRANSHSLAGCCEDAAAGKLTGAPVVDKEGSRGHSEERRDCSDRMLDAGSMEEAEFMMEGAECGDMPALQQLPSALRLGEATPRNAIFGRHHEILDDGATVPADSQQLEHPGSDGMRGRDPASSAYKAGRDHLYEATAAGRSSGGMDRDQPGSNPECLPSQEDQHTAAEGGSRSGRRLSSARCLLPLFTSSQSTHIMERKRQQQQQQQQRIARVPPPEHCPHSRLGLRRGRVEHSSAGVGGYKVKGRGKVVNTIELSTSTIKQTLKDSRPLLDQTRQACCTLRTAFLQPKVPNNLPYLPLGAASDIPPLLLPPTSYYASPTVNVSAKGAHRPSMPPGVSAVPELAFILHESGLCSPSHWSPELQCLFYEALGWGAQPVGQQQQRHGHAQQQQKQQQQQQRNERARCRNQAECSKRTEGPVNQRDGPSRGTAQSREAAKNERWVESGGGGGGQAVLEVEQGEGLQGGDSQELGAQGDQVLQGQEQGFEGQQEQEQSHQEQLCYQQQHADEQDEEESEREGGNLHGTKLWHGVRSGTGVGSQGVMDGFTARTYKLLLHLQQLFLGKGGSKAEEGGTLGSPTKKRRTQQAQKERGRLHEVLVVRELLAEQLQAAAKASAPCKMGKARTERRPSAGTSACQASAHRICAARMFHDMLVLQTGGYVRLQQTESFGDLRVREGHKLERCTSDLSLPGPGMGELPISLESL
ncbi:hypothetical protein DUNSADRAFT_9374 [Dunaliella salina]|nr:hypothetical protein DUNSADRAFT_9374 [Dunaliella salina]|eukprot:KAF5834098.1 hypothetical protein DUNSADRAFT_9374 [Dunaliella salina]